MAAVSWPALTAGGDAGLHLRRPACLISTTASPSVALETIVRALVAAKFREVRTAPTARRLKVGSPAKSIVSNVIGVELLPRMGDWGLQATVDLEAGAPVDGMDVPDAADAPVVASLTSPADAAVIVVRVELHGLMSKALAVRYTGVALTAAVEALRAAGHPARLGPLFEAAALPHPLRR